MKESFYWMDDNYETREYPVSKFKEIVLGEVGEGQATSENEKHADIHGIPSWEVLPQGRIEEELQKARIIVVDKWI
jgi:hypothetical protein